MAGDEDDRRQHAGLLVDPLQQGNAVNQEMLNKLKPGDRIRFAAEMKGGNAIVSRYEMAK